MKRKRLCPISIVFLLFVFSLSTFRTGISSAQSTESLSPFQAKINLKMGDKYYDSREIPGNLEKSHEYYIEISRAQPEIKEVLWRLSRSFRTLGVRAISKKEKLSYFQKAIQFGEKAIQADYDSYRSHLWLGISMGSYALEKGVMESLNLKEKIKFELGTVLEMDPNNIRARLALAHWYFYLPEILDGNKQKAINFTNEAISLDPNYTRSRLLKAKLLKDWGKKEEAVGVLQSLLNIQSPSESAAAFEDRDEAKKLLAVLR